MPPVAMTGRATALRTEATRSGSRTGARGRSGVRVAECPPAAGACTITASTPDAAALRASSAEVTLCSTVLPARRRALTTARSGMPKVKDTHGTGAEVNRSILSVQWSSSSIGSGGSVSP